MGGHLQLLPKLGSGVPMAAVIADMPREPRVFNAGFIENLGVLNRAERELRRLGFHVVWSRAQGDFPRAHIRRDAEVSMSPLLDRMGPRTFHPERHGVLVRGDFNGVVLSWFEPDSKSQENKQGGEA